MADLDGVILLVTIPLIALSISLLVLMVSGRQ